MNLIFHQFKKDVRRFRLLLGAWFLVLVLQTAGQILQFSVYNAISLRLLAVILMLLPLLQKLLVVIIVPLVIHEEPLTGSTAFWFTRPVSRMTLLGAKSVFLAVFLILPVVMAETVVLAASGATLNHIIFAIPESIIREFAFLLPLMVLASLTRSFVVFALIVLAFYSSYLLLSVPNIFMTMRNVFFTGGTTKTISLTLSRDVIEIILTIVCGVGLVFHQYLTRRTSRTATAAVAAFLFVSIAVQYIWPWDFYAEPVQLDRAISRDKVEVSPRGGLLVFDLHYDKKRVGHSLKVIGMPPAYFARIRQVTGGKIRFSTNTVGYSPSGCDFNFTLPNLLKNVDSDALQSLLEGTILLNPKETRLPDVALMDIRKEDIEKNRGKSGTYTGNALLSAYRYEVVAELPLTKKGSHWQDDSEHFIIGELSLHAGGCTVLAQQRRFNLLFSRGAAANILQFLMPGDKGGYICVLRNRRLKVAILPDDKKFSKISFRSTTYGHLIVNNFKLNYSGDARRQIDQNLLVDADLVLVKAVPAGEFSRPLKIEDVFLSKEQPHLIDKKALEKIASLPESPTEEQVRSYIRAILKASACQMMVSSNDPQVAMLEKIGSENLDLLVEESLAYTHAHPGTAGNLHVEVTLTNLAKPEHKASILKALYDYPGLADVVIREGWQNEARDILLRKLREHPRNLRCNWIQAAASLQDPSTYEDLKRCFINSYNKKSFVPILKELPGFDLPGAVAAGWSRYKSYKGMEDLGGFDDTSVMISIAMEFGHVDAIEAVFKLKERYHGEEQLDYYRKEWLPQLQELTGITGGFDEIDRWFQANKNSLVFDPEKRRFVIRENKEQKNL